MTSPIHFGTSGWRAIIADEFTFASVRIACAAIAEHVCARKSNPTLIIGYDTRFESETFASAAAEVLRARGVNVLLCDAAAPTPAIAVEIRRRKTNGAVTFTASHNPAEYNGLKFSGADGGPALPEVTKDIEARCAKLAAKGVEAPANQDAKPFEMISVRESYLARLTELVRLSTIREAKIKSVCDALHGCGAGYLDRILRDNGISAAVIRANRDVLFDGTGPDVSEANLTRLRDAVLEQKADVGLATDGDADRFGIIDRDGDWIQPNHILGLVYDYLIETRGWKMPAARSVATSSLLDAVARTHGHKVFETPVGFKYIGALIQQDKIAMGGEESAGLSVRGHIPEKDGILACLLVAEMIAARRAPLREQLAALFKRLGREFWPLRQNLHLTEEVNVRTIERLKGDFRDFCGHRVARCDRTDGLKLEFDDGSWLLMRLSGTEPVLRLYTEASSLAASRKLAEEAQQWIEETPASRPAGRKALA
jgi:phosphoglucomutase